MVLYKKPKTLPIYCQLSSLVLLVYLKILHVAKFVSGLV